MKRESAAIMRTGRRLVIAQFAVLSVALALDGRWLGAAEAVEGYRADLVNREVLRVCTDPANMPFSNDQGEGFDTKIAEIVGEELRNTLFAKRCDLVIETGQGDPSLLNTNAISPARHRRRSSPKLASWATRNPTRSSSTGSTVRPPRTW